MKRFLRLPFLISIVLITALASCSSDDETEDSTIFTVSNNTAVIEGIKYRIVNARFSDVMSDSPITFVPIDLYLDDTGENYVTVQCEKEDLGKEIPLEPFGKKYTISYYIGDNHSYWYRDTDYGGGSFSENSVMKITSKGNGVYSVELNLTETTSSNNPFTMKLKYEGTPTNNWVDK